MLALGVEDQVLLADRQEDLPDVGEGLLVVVRAPSIPQYLLLQLLVLHDLKEHLQGQLHLHVEDGQKVGLKVDIDHAGQEVSEVLQDSRCILIQAGLLGILTIEKAEENGLVTRDGRSVLSELRSWVLILQPLPVDLEL